MQSDGKEVPMLTPDLTTAVWRKSIRSSGANNCVEVAGGPGWAAVRDSKDLSGPVLAVSVESFRVFVAGVRAGTFGPA
jgi:hypothetical protein